MPGIRLPSPAADELMGLESVQAIPAPLIFPQPNWEVGLLPGPGVASSTPLGPPTFLPTELQGRYVCPTPLPRHDP